MIHRVCLMFLLVLYSVVFVFGQSTPAPTPEPTPTPTSSPLPGSTPGPSASPSNEEDDDKDYESYTIEEFHPILHGIRRSEVLFFGAIPITYLYCNFGYMAYSEATGNKMDSEDKNYMLLYSSLSLAAGVVILDLILGYFFD